MKKLIITILTLALASTIFAADSSTGESYQNIQYAIIGYEYGLFSENESVVISSMKNAIEFHAMNPDYNFAKISNRLEYLVMNAESTTLRHDAYVASLYFRHPEWFAKKELLSLSEKEEDPRQFFVSLFESVKGNLYATN